MREVLIVAGLLLVLIGFMLIFVGTVIGSEGSGAETGGVIMIGPIPIVFGTSRRMAVGAMVLAVLLMALWLAFFVFSMGMKR
ncbi:MAG: DUF131 domain-containing protein [Thermococci archaeon]|nr:DUF131 domain-containing protein [Thermococci archaeon]